VWDSRWRILRLELSVRAPDHIGSVSSTTGPAVATTASRSPTSVTLPRMMSSSLRSGVDELEESSGAPAALSRLSYAAPGTGSRTDRKESYISRRDPGVDRTLTS